MLVVRRLLLGLTLIAATSGVLLLSDLDSRIKPAAAMRAGGESGSNPARAMRVALLQHASQTILDDGSAGMIAGLADKGWIEGQNLKLTRYNAQGDMPTAQSIAQGMVGGNYDLLLSNSTPSLQAVATANQAVGRNHVFGLVTDPYGAGVGINRDNHRDHPPYLAGYGTMQPVELALRTARQMYPALSRVGVVWNAAETNSEAQLVLARSICADLGIELLEATVENTAGVAEAAAAVVSRGAEAIWVPGDVSVIVGIDGVIAAARKGHIPTFSVIPPNVRRGTLFDVGADYHAVGFRTGQLAGDILNGLDPASVSIDNYMPEQLMINRQALNNLKDDWTIPADLITSARLVIDEQGVEHEKAMAPRNSEAAAPGTRPLAQPGQTYRIAAAYFAPDDSREICQEGLLDGLAELGFEVGRNLEISETHAQGEMVNIRPMLVNLDHTPVDAIVTFSTPVLQGALLAVKEKPVVFTFVTDPLAAGAGPTFKDHAPGVTGIGSLPPLDELLRLTQLAFPHVKRIGTLYNSGEANSVKVVSMMRDLCDAAGIELVELTAANTGEVIQAAQGLVSRNIDVFYVPSDNTAYQAIEAVAKTAATAGIPLIGEDATYLDRGFLFTVGPGFYFSGKAAAEPLARVLLGGDPADIPLANVSVGESKFNRAQMQALGLQIPEDVIAEIEGSQSGAPVNSSATAATARTSARSPNPSGKTWNLQLYFYMESPPFEQAIEGIEKVLHESPLEEGRDYTLRIRSAQGDIGALSGIVDAILTDRADIVIPLSTPATQVAAARIKDRPVLFGVVADPVAAGAAKSYTDHPDNLTGITVMGPAAEMLDLLAAHFPDYRRLGTLFCPSEANSVFFKDTFEKLCQERGYELVAVAANSPSELPDAALALVSRSVDAIVQIPDNQSSAGFAAITRAARQARTPLLSLNNTSVEFGAAIAIGRDYGYSGEELGKYIVRVIGGESPADIPIMLSPRIYIAASVPNADAVGMTLPDSLLSEARTVER